MLLERLTTIFDADTGRYEAGARRVLAQNRQIAGEGTKLGGEIRAAFAQGITDRLEGSLGSITGLFGSASGAVTKFLGPTALAAGAVAGLGAAMVKLGTDYAQSAKEIAQTNKLTGLSVELLSALRVPINSAGTDLKNLAEGYTQLSTNALAASASQEKAAEFSRKFGVTTTEVLKSPDEALKKIFARLQSIPSAAERAAQASALFGEETGRAVAVVAASVGNVDQFIEKMRRLGVVMDKEGVAAAAVYSRSLTELNVALTGIQQTIGARVIPAMADLAGALSQSVQNPRGSLAFFLQQIVSGQSLSQALNSTITGLSALQKATTPPADNTADLAQQQAATEALAQKAKRASEILEDLRTKVRFFGDSSQVAATQQRLLEAGLDATTSAAARQALVYAGLLDVLERQRQDAAAQSAQQVAEVNRQFEVMRGHKRTTQALTDEITLWADGGNAARAALQAFNREVGLLARGIKTPENLLKLLAALREIQGQNITLPEGAQAATTHLQAFAATLANTEIDEQVRKNKELGTSFTQLALDFQSAQQRLAVGGPTDDATRFIDSLQDAYKAAASLTGNAGTSATIRRQLEFLRLSVQEFRKLGGDVSDVGQEGVTRRFSAADFGFDEQAAERAAQVYAAMLERVRAARDAVVAGIKGTGAAVTSDFGNKLVEGFGNFDAAQLVAQKAEFLKLQEEITAAVTKTSDASVRARTEQQLLTGVAKDLTTQQKEQLLNEADQADTTLAYQRIVAGLTAELNKNAEATAAQRLETKLATDAAKRITPELQEYLRTLAKQADAHKEAAEAQEKLQRLTATFENVITDTFRNAQRGGLRAVLAGWLEDFAQFLHQLVAKALAAKLAQALFGGLDAMGGGGNGGNGKRGFWGGLLQSIIGSLIGGALGGSGARGGSNPNVLPTTNAGIGNTILLIGGGTYTVPGRAGGGFTAGGMTLVGEEGPELVDFSAPARVYTAGQTSRLLTQNSTATNTRIFNITLPAESRRGYQRRAGMREAAQELTRYLRFAVA